MLLCGCCILALCSCQIISSDELVEFELPEWPEYLPELKGWRVEVFYDWALRQAQGPQIETPPDTKIISFHLNKNRPCCITATPITQTKFFKSAGTIYPYSNSIIWSGGYAAYLFNTAMNALSQNGYDNAFIQEYASSFNWEKLLQTLEEKQQDQETFYNPWLLDTQEVLEGIAYHSFTATKLKLSQTICVELDFEFFSSYVPENEFLHQNDQPYVTVKKDVPEVFALRFDAGAPESFYALLISASSAKNISLEFISMPIYIEEI